MEENKSIFASVTFWGAIISILGKVAALAGWDLGDLSGVEIIIASFVGDAMALIGRFRAKKTTTLTGK